MKKIGKEKETDKETYWGGGMRGREKGKASLER